MTTLGLELAKTDADLRALARDWDGLHRSIPGAMPFQSPAWLLPWWQQFGTGRPLLALLRDGDGIPTALLPLYILDEPSGRKLLPIGAGITDYLDILIAPPAPADAAQLLLAAALADAAEEGIRICDLIELPPCSKLRDVAPPPGWREAFRWREVCPVLNLPSGVSRLKQVVPEGKLRDVRLARNRAARVGDWACETAGAETLLPLLDELMRMHQERWQAMGQPGVFADPRVVAFHRSAAPELLARGMLRLYALRIAGRIAGAYYVLMASDGRMLAYICGFDRAFAHESPGTLLIAAMVEQAMREGGRELHFLRGGEAYKYEWGAEERANAARRFVPCEP